MKHGSTHLSLRVPSHNAVLPSGSKVGHAAPSRTSVPGEVIFLEAGCAAPSPFPKQLRDQRQLKQQVGVWSTLQASSPSNSL